MKLNTILESLGLTPKESQVYLSLLSYPELGLTDLAEVAGLPRTSIYSQMQTLASKGAVEHYQRRGRRVYVATPPERLLALQQSHLRRFQDNLDRFRQIIPDTLGRPSIKCYEGGEGIKQVFAQILTEKQAILALVSVDDMRMIAGENFDDFIGRRIQQQLPVRLITNRLPYGQKLKSTDTTELRHTRFVPSNYRFQTANYITADKVVLISLCQQPYVAVVIHDKAIADTHRMYFDLMWNSLSA